MANDDPKIVLKAEDKTGKAFKSAQRNLQNLASSSAILEGPLGAVAGRINSLGAALGRVNPGIIAFGTSFAASVVVVKRSLEEFTKYEQQMMRLDGVLRATSSSSGLTADEIDRFSIAIGEATLASAGGARDAAAALMNYRSIAGDTFKEVLSLSQDVSEVFGGDLRSNTIKIARALENPAEALTTLNRNILPTTKAWRDMVTEMFEAGNEAEATRLILDKLATQVGGAGAAAAGGLAGKLDTLGERWTNLLVTIGEGALGDAAGSFLDTLSGAVKGLDSIIESTTNSAKAQALFASTIEPNIELLNSYGIKVRTATTDLAGMRAMIESAGRIGIDLVKSSNLNGLNEELERLKASEGRVAAALSGGEVGAESIARATARLEELRAKIAEIEGKVVTVSGQKDQPGLTAEEQEARRKADEFRTQQANEKAIAADIAQSEVMIGLRNTHLAKVAALEEREALKADTRLTSDLEKLQMRFLSEENLLTEKLAREKLLLDEALMAGKLQEDEFRAYQLVVSADYENSLTQIKQDGEKKRTRAVELAEKERKRIQIGGLNAAGNILGALSALQEKAGKESRKRGDRLARASIVASTAAAIMSALETKPYFLGLALAAGAAVQGANQLRNVGGNGSEISTPVQDRGSIAPPSPVVNQFSQEERVQYINVNVTAGTVITDDLETIIADAVRAGVDSESLVIEVNGERASVS